MDSRTTQSESPSGPPGNPSNHRHRTRRILRGRIACLRCQRRKIRCDGVVPSCGSCSKAGVECIDGGKVDGIDSPRAYILSLKNRVKWLEAIIRTNCPQIDLAQGPRVPNESGTTGAVASEDEPSENHAPILSAEGLVQTSVESAARPTEHSSDAAASNVLPALETPIIPSEQPASLAHEIGLVSLSAGTDPRYIGPSSGYFFGKLLLACARQSQRPAPLRSFEQSVESPTSRLFPHGIISSPSAPLPEILDHTIRISEVYFDTIHLQYPFLHRPSHMKLIEHVYAEPHPNATALFQVHMVLAIGATVLSRRLKITLPAEGFCASAMKHFDKLSIENSLRGVQSLLLLLMYTLCSPSMNLNVWYLNYQCIAAVLDLGLQRDVRSGKTISVLDQEMRTRIFWVIYSLDRSVATMMGRPIGLRDEACELRLPADVEDDKLSANQIKLRLPAEPPHSMTYAIHLFKLAQLNSEMKYVLHSISHDTPSYTYPSIPDILQWQVGMSSRVQAWFQDIPQFIGDRAHLTKLCEVKYHEIRMLLFRPSPAIPRPSVGSLTSCYESAVASIRLYDHLYRNDILVYSWSIIHSVFLSTITMLYCIWTVVEVTAQVKLDVLMADLKAASNVLSATGEHWAEAKRSRDVLDELSGTTVRWIMELRARGSDSAGPSNQTNPSRDNNLPTNNPGSSIQSAPHVENQFTESSAHNQRSDFDRLQWLESDPEAQDFGSSAFIPPLFDDENLSRHVDFSDSAAVSAIMFGVFNDFQQTFNFSQDFEMDQITSG